MNLVCVPRVAVIVASKVAEQTCSLKVSPVTCDNTDTACELVKLSMTYL